MKLSIEQGDDNKTDAENAINWLGTETMQSIYSPAKSVLVNNQAEPAFSRHAVAPDNSLFLIINAGGTIQFSAVDLGALGYFTGFLPVQRGGTGLGSIGTALQVLRVNAAGTALEYATPSAGMTNPMTTLGDTIFGAASGTPTRLAGNTTTTKRFLTQTGTGTISAAPIWGTIDSTDINSAYSFTNGSIMFWNSGFAQKNANLFWDNTNNRLGININSSLLSPLHVRGASTSSLNFTATFQDSAGNNIFRLRDDRGAFFDGNGVVINSINTASSAIQIDVPSGFTGNDNIGAFFLRGANVSGPRMLLSNSATASTNNSHAISFMFNATAGTGFIASSITSRLINIGSGTEMGNLAFRTNVATIANNIPAIRGAFVGDRFVIGLAADADYLNYANALARLHVRGNDALSTSSTAIFQNSAAAEILRIYNNQRVMIAGVDVTATPLGVGIVSGRAATIGNLDIVSNGATSWTGVGISIAAGNRTIEFIGVAGNQINVLDDNRFTFRPNGGFATTRASGVWNDIRLGAFNFAPTSGNAVYNGINLDITVNQTGGANGIVRGFFANITNTASTDLRAFEATTGIVLLGRMAADPAINNGAIYYNTTTNKFRGCENGVWANLI